jgi:nitric oxide reductase subunit B
MKRYWIAFASVIFIGFLVLGWAGFHIYQEKPPIPETVETLEGVVLIKSGEIIEGQNIWQSLGGMELGSVWGHGSYVAPDWTADWLHRECMYILYSWSKRDYYKTYAELSSEEQAMYRDRLSTLMRKNTY